MPVPVPMQSAFTSKKRSLLGYDDPEGEQLMKTTEEQLKAQQEAKIGQLLEGWAKRFFLLSSGVQRTDTRACRQEQKC